MVDKVLNEVYKRSIVLDDFTQYPKMLIQGDKIEFKHCSEHFPAKEIVKSKIDYYDQRIAIAR